ncbi:hypothetical protein MTO96_000156 [Rhipicephalus appendiculatus]
MSQKAPPQPPDPREDGYDYRLDVSIGDKNDDRFWGEEIVKPSRKLSFERDIRVQEFEKERRSCEVRKLVRSPETKARATEPSLESSGSVSQKSRRSRHKRKKKRKSKKKRKKKKKKKRSRDDSSTTATTGETTESREDQSVVSSAVANISTAVAPASPYMDERALDAAAIGEPAGVMQPTDVTATEPLTRTSKRDKRRRSSREDDSAAIWTPASGGEAMGSTDVYSQQWTKDTVDRQGDYGQPRYPVQGAYDQQASDYAAYAAPYQPTDVTATEPLPRISKRDKRLRSSREDDSAAIWTPASGGEAMGFTDMYGQQWTTDTIDRQGDYRQPRYSAQGAYDQRASDYAPMRSRISRQT